MPEHMEERSPATERPESRGREKDLEAPDFEAKELDKLLQRGHRAHGIIGLLTVVGVAILGGAYLYYQDRFDYYAVGDRTLVFPAYLDKLLENQVLKDRATYGARGPSHFPVWPGHLYRKLRFDIFLLAGGGFLLALVFIHIALMRTYRHHLLLYRGLGREIEKLRRRVRELEGKPAKPKAASGGGGSGGADDPSSPEA